MSASPHTQCEDLPTICWHTSMKCCLCSAVHPVLTLFIPLLRLQWHRPKCMWTYCTCMWTLINFKLNTFQFPRHFIYFLLAQLPRPGKRQRKRSCCCLSRLGASCADRGPSRDIPERSCWSRGGKSWVFWTPFNDSQSYLAWVWYASTSWA